MSTRFVVQWDGEDWAEERVVEAHDANHAATEAVEQWENDSADYEVANQNQTVTVRVRESGPGEEDREWRKFKVHGEWVTAYYADEIEPELEPQL